MPTLHSILRANLPANGGRLGELWYCVDTRETFISTGFGTAPVASPPYAAIPGDLIMAPAPRATVIEWLIELESDLNPPAILMQPIALPFELSRLTGWEILSDAQGDLELDILLASYSSYPNSATILSTATNPPRLVNAIKAQGDVAGWDNVFGPGTSLQVSVVSARAVRRVTFSLGVEISP